MKIYVASAWRNQIQPDIVHVLRAAGYEVYDFRNPGPGLKGFAWSEIDPMWQHWSPEAFNAALDSPGAVKGFCNDMDALQDADVCVLVLPCGRSAHLELGYAVGAGKPTYVLMLEPSEPELMYRMCSGICTSILELHERLAVIARLYRSEARR